MLTFIRMYRLDESVIVISSGNRARRNLHMLSDSEMNLSRLNGLVLISHLR